MALIKLYQSQARAPGARGAVTSGVRFTAADFSSETLGKSIKQVFDVKQAYDKKAIQDERNETEKFLAETRLNWTQKTATDMEEASLRGNGASGFTENLMSSFEDYAKNNSNSGSDEDNIYRKTQLTKIQAGLLGPSARYQAKEAGKFRAQTITTAQNSHMSNVYTNPDSLNNAIEEMRTTANRLGLTGQALEDQVKSTSNELGKMTLTGIIDRMTPKEANQLHEELTNGTSDWVTKINGDDVDNMARYAKSRATATTKAEAHNTYMFNNNMTKANTAVKNGFPVNSQMITQLSSQIDKMPDDGKKVVAVQKLQNLIVTTKVVQHLENMTIPEATAVSGTYQARANKEGSTPLDVEIAIAAKNATNRMQARAKDPIQYGIERGEIMPVDVRHLESLDERGVQARKIAEDHDVPFKMFSNQETVSITNQFEAMPPIEQAELANRIVQSAGSDAIPVMAEFKKINPNLAVMGSLKAKHSSAFNSTLQIIAKGADLAKKNELMESVDYKEVITKIREELQPVLFETGGDNLAAYTKAAIAFYVGKGGTAGKDFMGLITFDEDLVNEAINSVLGHPALEQDNTRKAIHEVEPNYGDGKIVLPFDVTGDEYDDATELMNNDDLQMLSGTGGIPVYKGQAIDATNLIGNAIPVVDRPTSALEPGEVAYSFRDADGNFIQDDTGMRYQIILSADIIDELMRRKMQED